MLQVGTQLVDSQRPIRGRLVKHTTSDRWATGISQVYILDHPTAATLWHVPFVNQNFADWPAVFLEVAPPPCPGPRGSASTLLGLSKAVRALRLSHRLLSQTDGSDPLVA